ncbi:peptide chain release factor N(5)-glutamine methyltransferase [Flavobacterium sp. XGLA_31]|uniref:peptide chain release factor N(5)-glutamine methyltransferase n=1 Tax=Flavobacterium sp. XGLA_31 TaxID=3447666 RepID=UPI003F347AAA
MLLKEYRDYFRKELLPIYDEQEVDSFFYLILEKLHRLKRIDLALAAETLLEETKLSEWNAIISELQKQKPIQYLLGETEFYGLPFLVNENVLIPRPETEELVELILSNVFKVMESNPITILDIGTGSGCISIALAKNISASAVHAIDVSEAALATARRNAENNQVKVNFLLKNILETEDLEQQFDIIVSNPPYVRNLEKTEIKPNVLAHEPHLALFVDDEDALIFYRKIAQLAQKNLKPNGWLYFEINQYLGKETAQLLKDLGFQQVTLLKDIYGNDRMLSATYS